MNKKSTRRSFGRRALAFGVAMFAMVTLTAVGFAAWLISSNSTASGSGAINTEVVNYANVTLKINNLNEKGELADGEGNAYHIYFAPPETDSVKNSTGLVTYKGDGSDKPENLTFKFSGTIGNLNQIQSLKFSLKLPDAIIKAAGYTFNDDAWSFSADNVYIELPSYAVDENGKSLPLVVEGVVSGETTGPVEFEESDLAGLMESGTTKNGVTLKKNGNDGTFEGIWEFKWGKRYGNENPANIFNKPNFDLTAGVESNQVYTRNQVFCELLKLQAAVNGLTLSDYYPEGLKTALDNSTNMTDLDKYVKNTNETTVGNYLNGIQENLKNEINKTSQNLVYTLFIEATAK